MKGSVYVLYLQFEKKLDEKFLTLSRVYSQYGMTLVPISVEDFKTMSFTSPQYVLAIVRDITSLKEYKSLLKRYLNYMMRTGKVTLFELSSFEVIQEVKLLKEGRVFQERLPMTMFQTVDLVGRKIYLDLTSGSKRWPGGRRAKLPSV
ncbi:hypothetical protein [Bacteriovorax sp. Seq25_V]|uniref:hypothetical protein n=1 Tax=Bacteriovorax sp. Seq25_V TaxID=1201288 RepID=UPI00038A312A|nr:hypothetical protein [Bacteriovorax sp. Seq25_V]EQC44827.1 hypothetical protein M900_0356 [Bacteriovorax sp. Seq25_V]